MDKENTKKEGSNPKDIKSIEKSAEVSGATKDEVKPSKNPITPLAGGEKKQTVYAKKRFEKNRGRRNNKRSERPKDEFEQKLNKEVQMLKNLKNKYQFETKPNLFQRIFNIK